MKKRSVLAIVGRPNVGKSALFNRISRKQISLVYDTPGVTRDRITLECLWNGRPFTLIDTGGVGLDDASGFEQAIQNEVNVALGTATDILLVVDGREGLHPLDVEIAKRLRRVKQQVYLVVNKMDTDKQAGGESEFHRLGFDEMFMVSAAHGRGIQEMMGQLSAEWSEGPADSSRHTATRVAIVGRPNAGKSSLINALLDEKRVIVSPIAGTTRDAVDVYFTRNDTEYCLIDTAGMRRRSRVSDPLEQAMASRSAHAINRADVCVLVVDAVEGIAVQEKKIAGLIEEAGKPCLIVVNKWDLARGEKPLPLDKPSSGKGKPKDPPTFKEQYEKAVRSQMFFLDYAPVVFVSAAERQNLDLWVNALELVCRNRRTEIPGGPLNRAIRRAYQAHQPHSRNGKHLKIYYVSQDKEETKRPTLNVFINDRKLWTDDYARYLEQHIRSEFELAGCPLKWFLKDKKTGQKAEEKG